MTKHLKEERTLVIIKPDGVQRTLIGEVIKRFERVGLKLIALKMMMATAELIKEHYTFDPNWEINIGSKSIKGYKDKGLIPPHTDPKKVAKIVLNNLIRYMTSGPIVAMVWEGAHAVQIVRKITGGTEPLTSDVGTIRGDYVLDSYQMSDLDGRAVRNVIHVSGTVKEANDEINHWFKKGEIMKYKTVHEQILYDIELHNFS